MQCMQWVGTLKNVWESRRKITEETTKQVEIEGFGK